MTGPTERADPARCPDCGGRTDRPYLVCSICRDRRRNANRARKAARQADAAGLERLRATQGRRATEGTNATQKRRWTEDEDATMVAAIDRPAREVAAQLGRSVDAVAKRRSRLLARGGLTRPDRPSRDQSP